MKNKLYLPPWMVESGYSTVSVLGRDEGYMVKYNLCLKEFPRAKPEGIPEGKGLYLTVYLTVYSLGSVL